MLASQVLRRALLVALAVVVIGALVMVALPGGRAAMADGVAWLRAAGATGRAIAVAVVVLAIPLGAPTLWLAALVGYLFGVAAGWPIAIGAVLCGALAAFTVSRWLLRAEVERLVARRPRWRAVIDAVGDEGTRLIVLLRLAGPHNVLNVTLASAPVTTRQFALGTLIGMLPSVSLAALGGALAPDAASLWQARDRLGPAWIAVLVCGAIALVVAVVAMVRATRRALARSGAQ